MNAWDAWAALIIAVVVLVAMLASSRDLEPTGTFATASITSGVALATLDLVALRWVSDRMKDSAYGELVRARDRDEAEVSQPYWIVAVSGMLTATLGLIGAALDGELPRWLVVTYWFALALLAAYALLGSFSLLRLTMWHQRQHALLQEMRDRDAREQRRRRRKSQEPDETGASEENDES